MVRRLSQTLGTLGTLTTLIATTAAIGCCGVALLGPAAALGAAAFAMLPAGWSYEALYSSLGLALVALGLGALRHRRVYPLVLAVAGSLALLAALHEAWDVGVFRLLVWGGLVALAAGAASDLWLRTRGCLWPEDQEA